MRTAMISGGRGETRAALVRGALDILLDNYGPFDRVIHGACKTGVDAIADAWARDQGIDVKPYPADWGRLKRAAGPVRNQQMVDSKPDYVFILPGGDGTADARARAEKAGLKVVVILRYEGDTVN